MPYRLSFENAVRGIRFQPIYSVAEKAIKAREILSLLQPGINHEQYFASQSDQTLKWSTKLATALEFFQYRFSDSFGVNPPLYSCGLSAL